MRTAPLAIAKVAALALWLSASAGGQGVLATLSGDLVALLLGGQTAPVRVIVGGDVAAIQQILWGDETSGQEILWGDADVTGGQQILWGDTVRGQ